MFMCRDEEWNQANVRIMWAYPLESHYYGMLGLLSSDLCPCHYSRNYSHLISVNVTIQETREQWVGIMETVWPSQGMLWHWKQPFWAVGCRGSHGSSSLRATDRPQSSSCLILACSLGVLLLVISLSHLYPSGILNMVRPEGDFRFIPPLLKSWKLCSFRAIDVELRCLICSWVQNLSNAFLAEPSPCFYHACVLSICLFQSPTGLLIREFALCGYTVLRGGRSLMCVIICWTETPHKLERVTRCLCLSWALCSRPWFGGACRQDP